MTQTDNTQATRPANGTPTAFDRHRGGRHDPATAVIELRPTLPVPVDEMWFWSEEHQAAEREVEDDLAAGRFRIFDDSGSFLADLESPAADPDR